MVSRLQPDHSGTDLFDDAGPLVPSYAGKPGNEISVPEVLVRVAEPGRHVSDQDLALLRWVEVEIGDFPVLPNTVEHRCLRLHPVHPSSPPARSVTALARRVEGQRDAPTIAQADSRFQIQGLARPVSAQNESETWWVDATTVSWFRGPVG